jgi:hypothetical protein
MIDLTIITRVLRAQAWERAKGELQSVLWTFHSPYGSNKEQFEELDALVENFIKAVEDKSLNE